MDLAATFSLLALLAAVAALGVLLRRQGGLPRQLEESAARQRQELLSQTALLLQPMAQDLRRLEMAQVEGGERLQRLQGEALSQRFGELGTQIQDALRQGRLEQHTRLQEVVGQVQTGLAAIQASTEQRLEAMRLTVDEKLHTTLDQRLGESFKLVSERLELVQRGLGEMQTLALDVGGLKRVLSNVKIRGVLGETQLAGLLEQFLAPGQYQAQVRLRPESRELVDFAVRLPGPDGEAPVWIPIDAKFPMEDYQRLLEAQERADLPAMERAGLELERRILEEARSIQEKYVCPPATTAFGLLFLPTEGLFAEVLRRPGLFEKLQNVHRVVVVGPTTLAAYLNALQMGFMNLAINNRSQEVWKVLGEVKTEFGRFSDWVAGVQSKLQSAAKEMDKVGTRTRVMARRLKDVHELPVAELPGAELETLPYSGDESED
jgi:DNA recombination protein RmuC